jgi:hypothetical protein
MSIKHQVVAHYFSNLGSGYSLFRVIINNLDKLPIFFKEKYSFFFPLSMKIYEYLCMMCFSGHEFNTHMLCLSFGFILLSTCAPLRAFFLYVFILSIFFPFFCLVVFSTFFLILSPPHISVSSYRRNLQYEIPILKWKFHGILLSIIQLALPSENTNFRQSFTIPITSMTFYWSCGFIQV